MDATSLTRQLFAYDRETGETKQVIGSADSEESFSAEEKLRRERARIMSVGVTEYSWAKRANRLLVPKDGALYVQDGVGESAGATLRRLFDPGDPKWAEIGSGAPLDAKLSDDGTQVFFVWDREVCACDVAESNEDDACRPRRLTSGARGDAGITNGIADYCAQEEMDRYTGYWPSPSGRGSTRAGSLIAFEEVDEQHIPLFTIMNQGVDGPHSQNEAHRYPFAGAANPKVQSRDQKSLALLKLNPETGDVSTLFTETSESWINLHGVFTPINGGSELLWASERSGWRHLYVHSMKTGETLRQLTRGNWAVDEVLAVDSFGEDEEEVAGAAAGGGYVYLLGSSAAGADGAPLTAGAYTEQQLFRVRLDGTDEAPERLTAAAGVHSGVAIAHKRTCFVDQYSSASEPMRAVLTPLDKSSEAIMLHDASERDARVGALSTILKPPSFASFPSTDGKVELNAALYAPDPDVHGPGPYPVVVSCYGGPHVQWVQNSWARMTADVSAQMYASQGYLVLKVDNRGADRRGLDFEAAIRGRLGVLEVEDQVAAVNYAVSRGLADAARVGIMGWSYGGYLSAMCLAKAPHVFRCAVAGAPVTSWDGYDTHYTERYCDGTPASNPSAYSDSSVMAHVEQMQGALMLVHGLMDENVHFRHTARLTQAMVEAQKTYELLCFPKERHSPRSLKDRTYMEQRIASFLHRWLKGE